MFNFLEILKNMALDLGYILIFPGFLFCFVVGLLLCGIDRKAVARMQKRSTTGKILPPMSVPSIRKKITAAKGSPDGC